MEKIFVRQKAAGDFAKGGRIYMVQAALPPPS
jgi:hypothetical protein